MNSDPVTASGNQTKDANVFTNKNHGTSKSDEGRNIDGFVAFGTCEGNLHFALIR